MSLIDAIFNRAHGTRPARSGLDRGLFTARANVLQPLPGAPNG